MSLPLEFLAQLQSAPAPDAWKAILGYAWDTCSGRLDPSKPLASVLNREHAVGDLDQFLATAGWDLWQDYDSVVDKTAENLVSWWNETPGGKAVLILDALSLRELPWILHGAQTRGYTLHQQRACASELPGDTNSFARALGFSSRAALENNGAPSTHRLRLAHTEATGNPWPDCPVPNAPRLVLWHHWPDDRVHELSVAGGGLEKLTPETAAQLTSDSFWDLVHRLTQGRRLLITSDHGYAASGLFADAADDQANYLKTQFGARRFTTDQAPEGPWTPPLDLTIRSRASTGRYALGRRKWKVGGGYPTLTHGGLSVLEVASPFIEISRA